MVVVGNATRVTQIWLSALVPQRPQRQRQEQGE
jgi:hypothetical protein